MRRRVRGFLLVSAPLRGQHHKAPALRGFAGDTHFDDR
jgi:hypothetical protein